MPETKPPAPHEEVSPHPPPPPEDINPALTLKGAGGVPGIERLGPWFTNTSHFLAEVNVEFRKITWPTRQQIITETGVVILISALLTGLVMGFDWIWSIAANRVFFGK